MITIQAYECLSVVHLTLVATPWRGEFVQEGVKPTIPLSNSHVPINGCLRTATLLGGLRHLLNNGAESLAGAHAKVWEDVL